jgi:lipopolysaccharide transport system ATP-binding protein
VSSVIEVDNVWKKYRLGVLGTGTLRHDLDRWWHRIRGKPDPYSKVDQRTKIESRKSKGEGPNGESGGDLGDDEMWALRGVSFEVKQGEILGIIGRNGAGKSTLLKILSRVTLPTKGEVRVKGRIASLLEVGTGFHPELTGRENIFLNGAILGMNRSEIKMKFDEIVTFAGIQTYIDTPVKRYSSGMYVRLAFAVAAHLDPEILIVDEVLAVGDAQFQKRCLGTMGDIARQGRTILFVSHNMTAIKSLCRKSISLNAGQIINRGLTDQVIKDYLSSGEAANWEVSWTNLRNAPGDGTVWLTRVKIAPEGARDVGHVEITVPLTIVVEYYNSVPGCVLNVSVVIYSQDDQCVLSTGSDPASRDAGTYQAVCFIPGGFLNDGMYRLRVFLAADSRVIVDKDHLVTFQLHDVSREGNWFGKWLGVVRPTFEWRTERIAQSGPNDQEASKAGTPPASPSPAPTH